LCPKKTMKGQEKEKRKKGGLERDLVVANEREENRGERGFSTLPEKKNC